MINPLGYVTIKTKYQRRILQKRCVTKKNVDILSTEMKSQRDYFAILSRILVKLLNF